MITLVVDCMGSDNGPKVLQEGIISFLEENKDCKIVACGKKEELDKLTSLSNVSIIDARDVLPMDVGPLEAARARESSLYKAVNYMKENNCDGVVSAGSTGGFLSVATIKLKLIEGIQRAALISPFPTKTGNPTIILDIGASNETNSDQLVQFAKMGSIYSHNIFKVDNPKVYLLSNGIEEEKGTPEIKEAHQKLKQVPSVNFKGNVEARDALDGHCDVIVTGGFAGNIFLKSSEGMAKMMSGMIKKAFYTNLLTKIGYLFSKKGFKEMKKTMDYETYGGAMLMGVNGVVVKAHGSATAFSFKCALDVAYKMAKSHIVETIKEEVNK